jgi:hypothetical protein
MQPLSKTAKKTDKYFETLNPYYKPSLTKELDDDDTLIFESRFESGNLRRAIQTDRFEYDLIMKTDYRTNNYT